MAATLPNAGIVRSLLQAHADPDASDAAGRSPLQYATLANDVKCMEQLLQHDADCNDESLHIASKLVDLQGINLLLNRGAKADHPGPVHCGGRTPLAELCRNADLTQNPPKLKKTLALLCETTTDLSVRVAGKTLIYQALDNNDPYKMSAALLSTCRPVRHALKDPEANVYSKGTLRYTPTAYIRHFRCVESRSRRVVDLARRCCNLENCPAPQLENLLHTYGCNDRFWDVRAGANQPEGLCNPPPEIIDAMRVAENARHEQARKDHIQRELDAAAAAEQRRKRETMRLEQEKRDAEIRAEKDRADADARAIRRRAEAEAEAARISAQAENEKADAARRREQREYNVRLDRDEAEYNEKQRRKRKSNDQQMRMLRDRSNIQIDQKKKEANISKDVMREQRHLAGEKRKMINDTTEMFKEAGYAGASRANVGRVLGEIEDA